MHTHTHVGLRGVGLDPFALANKRSRMQDKKSDTSMLGSDRADSFMGKGLPPPPVPINVAASRYVPLTRDFCNES